MTEELSSLATLLVVDYPTKRLPYAYWTMGLLDPFCLKRTEGLLFWKLGGTGQGLGFSAKPNWNRHALFATWESRESWEDFLRDSRVVRRFRDGARELWWVVLAPLRSRGAWDGRNPLEGRIGS